MGILKELLSRLPRFAAVSFFVCIAVAIVCRMYGVELGAEDPHGLRTLGIGVLVGLLIEIVDHRRGKSREQRS